MSEEAKDGALVFGEVFSQVAGGVFLGIDFSDVNYGGAREDGPPMFKPGKRNIGAATSYMGMRPTAFGAFKDQGVFEVAKNRPNLKDKASPSGLHNSDAIGRRVHRLGVASERYHTLGIAGADTVNKPKGLRDSTGQAIPGLAGRRDNNGDGRVFTNAENSTRATLINGCRNKGRGGVNIKIRNRHRNDFSPGRAFAGDCRPGGSPTGKSKRFAPPHDSSIRQDTTKSKGKIFYLRSRQL